MFGRKETWMGTTTGHLSAVLSRKGPGKRRFISNSDVLPVWIGRVVLMFPFSVSIYFLILVFVCFRGGLWSKCLFGNSTVETVEQWHRECCESYLKKVWILRTHGDLSVRQSFDDKRDLQ